ncbi:trehalose-6-phosphate synthase [Massilia forsythiae]|uniref:Trehalose-6-phosphate synthase n=1 Tax=Massilia forsythiae TaxID=2728020 RepID=A0A7Z2VTB3_9BURK|nr:trehalose-6-phosphate synthase [Massilia forsythiae]QJD98876.1 trehalose-6-phosphate synthase [Massilia forsythiae]
MKEKACGSNSGWRDAQPTRAHDVRDAADLARLLDRLDCGDDIVVVSNRAPWVHSHTGAGIAAARPPGGLVTALEAVLSAQGGCWIAHGSGSADRATCDGQDHVLPEHLPASYRLRRLWLSDAEVDGYYHGLANEALWPLCHRASVEPVFRASDWDCYRRVNRRFADAVVAEARSARPLVLVQDYHLALVPRMVRERLPDAVIVTFWHIPFPEPQSLARLPWRDALVDGLLCSTVVGLQTAADLAHFSAARAARAGAAALSSASARIMPHAAAGAYPISIAWPAPAVDDGAAARRRIDARFGVPAAARLLLGVDRLDYTKGLPERLRAFERFLERHPHQAGRVTLLQIAAPGRGAVPAYQRLEREVRALAARINARFGAAGRLPVLLHLASVDAATVLDCYRACDACLVTSLHDGMNLVAKEFVAARDDLRGALVLSRFAGAAAELAHALPVDPRDIEATAAAIGAALAMPAREQAARMAAMRAVVRRHTVFGWAARLLEDGVRAASAARRQAACAPACAPLRTMSAPLAAPALALCAPPVPVPALCAPPAPAAFGALA